MIITHNFSGANITVKRIDGNTVYLENQIRDTTEDWFYWAFRVDRANGRTIKFVFDKMRVGYFGAAKSYDLKNWEWTGKWDDDKSFTYTFGEEEETVYFAHNMVYSPEMLTDFTNKHGIEAKELCKSEKGRSVPVMEIGQGDEVILLTARHHSCESTGNYVLEGIIESYLENPIKGLRIVCVPFVDLDGVVDGDQGKARAPHDHNRDYGYGADEPSRYASIRAIKELVAGINLRYAFDCHSPWHYRNENDTIFLVRKSHEKNELCERFAKFLEESVTPDAFPYKASNDILPDVKWNKSNSPCFGNYMLRHGGAELALTIETAYFVADSVPFSQERARMLGKSFFEAIRKFHSR